MPPDDQGDVFQKDTVWVDYDCGGGVDIGCECVVAFNDSVNCSAVGKGQLVWIELHTSVVYGPFSELRTAYFKCVGIKLFSLQISPLF